MSVSVAVLGILTDEHSALFPSHAAAQFLKLVSHAVFYNKCLVSSYNPLIDDSSMFWLQERRATESSE